MSKEGDHTNINQDISIICQAPRFREEDKQSQRQTRAGGSYDEIDPKSISVLPLVTMPTSDITMNCSALQLCKQESININLESEIQDSPSLPKKNLIDYILTNAKKPEENVPTSSSDTKIKWPKRQVLKVCILLSIGLISLIVGIFTAAISSKASRGAVFWSVAAICFLPGIFYARKLYQALYSRNNDAKNQVMEEIPV